MYKLTFVELHFFQISPITVRGNEILRWAVEQVDIGTPDYADLIS